MLRKNPRGQVGDSLSWLVATILIVVLLLFFVFGSSLLAETKNIKKTESLESKFLLKNEDIFLKKSLFTFYSVNENNQVIMEKELKNLETKKAFNLDYEETKKEIFNNLK